MDPERRREISSKGGKSVAPKDRVFSRDRGLASSAGRKGAEERNRKPKPEPAGALTPAEGKIEG